MEKKIIAAGLSLVVLCSPLNQSFAGTDDWLPSQAKMSEVLKGAGKNFVKAFPVPAAVAAAVGAVLFMPGCAQGPDGQPVPAPPPQNNQSPETRRPINFAGIEGVPLTVACGCSVSWAPGTGTENGDKYLVYGRRLVYEGDENEAANPFVPLAPPAYHPNTTMSIMLSGYGAWQLYVSVQRLDVATNNWSVPNNSYKVKFELNPPVN